VVRVLVEMLEPYRGRVYDPCCGSGGMFVQSEKFVAEHGGRIGDIAIYGQESNYTTWRLAKMNLAVRGIDADIRWNNEGSFHKDEFPDLRFDYILANPPFNVSDWGGERLREDVRWTFGAPPVGNANFAWLQHIHWHLAPNGVAGVVLANGSMSSNQSGEGEIRRAMIEADVVDCDGGAPWTAFLLHPDSRLPVVSCPQQEPRQRMARPARTSALHRRAQHGRAGRPHPARAHRRGNPENRPHLPRVARRKRSGRISGRAGLLQIRHARRHPQARPRPHPGRYVGAAAQEDDGEPFAEKMARLSAQWRAQREEAARLDAAIEANLRELGF